MDIKPIEIFKTDQRGTIWICGKSNFIRRDAGSISADHRHPEAETCYLVKGKIELTTESGTQEVDAPIEIHLKENEYHKVLALTEIEIVYNRYK